HALQYALESGVVGLVRGYALGKRGTSGAPVYTMGQFFDADFFGVAYMHDLANGARGFHETNQAFDGVAHVAKTPRLLAASIDGDRRTLQSGLDEVGKHHAVAPGL